MGPGLRQANFSSFCMAHFSLNWMESPTEALWDSASHYVPAHLCYRLICSGNYGCCWDKNHNQAEGRQKNPKKTENSTSQTKAFFFSLVFSSSISNIKNFNSMILASMTAARLKETLSCLQSINISKGRIEWKYPYCKDKEVQVPNTAAVTVDKSWHLNSNQSKTWPCSVPISITSHLLKPTEIKWNCSLTAADFRIKFSLWKRSFLK